MRVLPFGPTTRLPGASTSPPPLRNDSRRRIPALDARHRRKKRALSIAAPEVVTRVRPTRSALPPRAGEQLCPAVHTSLVRPIRTAAWKAADHTQPSKHQGGSHGDHRLHIDATNRPVRTRTGPPQ